MPSFASRKRKSDMKCGAKSVEVFDTMTLAHSFGRYRDPTHRSSLAPLPLPHALCSARPPHSIPQRLSAQRSAVISPPLTIIVASNLLAVPLFCSLSPPHSICLLRNFAVCTFVVTDDWSKAPPSSRTPRVNPSES